MFPPVSLTLKESVESMKQRAKYLLQPMCSNQKASEPIQVGNSIELNV